MKENSFLDKKSLLVVSGKNADWKELAKDCVCFSNSYGGKILIGIENNADEPPKNQKIDIELIEIIQKKISSLTINVGITITIIKHENGGQYIELTVFRNGQSVASTTDGKYYMRVSDNCKPILPDEIERLFSEKNAFVWEDKIVKRIPLSECDVQKLNQFLKDIRSSERVSNFIKEMSDEEIVDSYFLAHNNILTNLGVLWIGQRKDRATIHYPPSVQFIKYDIDERKVFKKVWDDYTLNPKELINEILTQIPDWNEFIEVSDGMFRKNIYNYPPEVIRELIANALAHRNYSMRGDIFINLYHDKLEIHSPGLLPLGVTPQNILTKSVQRNPLLAKLFYDLKLMEKEGSGYDKVYELLLGNGKEVPDVYEGDDRVVVTVKKQIVNNEVLRLMDKASKELQLRQRELITLGLIAQNEGISSIELSNYVGYNKTKWFTILDRKISRIKSCFIQRKNKGNSLLCES